MRISPAEFRDKPVVTDEAPKKKRPYNKKRADEKDAEAAAARLWSTTCAKWLSGSTDH